MAQADKPEISSNLEFSDAVFYTAFFLHDSPHQKY